MGGVCSGVAKSKTKEDKGGVSGKSRSSNNFNKLPKESPYSNPRENDHRRTPQMYDSGELRTPAFSSELKPSKPSTPSRKASSKAAQKGSFLGRASNVGLDKAVEVLDTLGSSMSNLNPGSSFVSGIASRGNKISILAFEVANTIVKGANLMQSLSEENIRFLKKEVLHSEGVRQLVSTEMKELLMIAAADKREELEVFSREVIRFGDLCKDPQWHNLHRFFSRLDTDSDDLGQKQLKTEAETTMQELSTLAEHTSELYHELHALDRFEQDYKQRIEEAESLNLPRKGEGITMSLNELKLQKKLVRTLKKKSLWSKTLEEIMEKLVDIVTFIHQEIFDIFGDNGTTFLCKDTTKGLNQSPQRLGTAGLALHYANVINMIDTIASRPAYLPPNTRDSLYNGLPPTVKKSLRSYLQTKDSMEELSVSKVKAEMEKTLQWLVPVATNTIKAHQGFGWVGEWANTGSDFGKSKTPSTNLIRLQTLYHADKQKADAYILEMVTWLHRLFNLVRHREDASVKSFPTQPIPNSKQFGFYSKLPSFSYKPRKAELSDEDRDLLNQVCRIRRLVPGISKSQEFGRIKRIRVHAEGSRSEGNSPNKDFDLRLKKRDPEISVWDMMDGLHSSTMPI